MATRTGLRSRASATTGSLCGNGVGLVAGLRDKLSGRTTEQGSRAKPWGGYRGGHHAP